MPRHRKTLTVTDRIGDALTAIAALRHTRLARGLTYAASLLTGTAAPTAHRADR